jgi:hypothetical protein
MTRGSMRVCGWGARSDYVGKARRWRKTVARTSTVWSWETMRRGVAMLSCRRRGKEVRSGRGHEESRRQDDAMWGLGQQPEVMDAMWGGVDHQHRGGAGEVLRRGGGVKEVCRCLGGAWEDQTSAQEQERRPTRGNGGLAVAQVNLWAGSHKREHQGVDIS